jgi:hypothetical protein
VAGQAQFCAAFAKVRVRTWQTIHTASTAVWRGPPKTFVQHKPSCKPASMNCSNPTLLCVVIEQWNIITRLADPPHLTSLLTSPLRYLNTVFPPVATLSCSHKGMKTTSKAQCAVISHHSHAGSICRSVFHTPATDHRYALCNPSGKQVTLASRTEHHGYWTKLAEEPPHIFPTPLGWTPSLADTRLKVAPLTHRSIQSSHYPSRLSLGYI